MMLVLLMAIWPLVSDGPPQESLPSWRDEDLLVLELRWKSFILSDGMLAGWDGKQVFLPLGELCRVLEYPIQVDPLSGRAWGWLQRDVRDFTLNIPKGELMIEAKSMEFDPREVQWRGDEIYVTTRALSRWLPVNLLPNNSESTVVVDPRETLPFERRRQRQAKRILTQKGAPTQGPAFPRIKQDYRMLSWPFMEGALNLSYQNGAESVFQPNLVLRGMGDLGLMDAELSLSGSPLGESVRPLESLSLELGRKDPNGRLLGPLRATRFALGDIFTPSQSFVSSGVRGPGLSFSNEPLERPPAFDHVDLEGHLPPGWEVELYHNDSLIDFREPTANTRYHFAEVPLFYGENLFRLVFYGPQGQEREQTKRYNIDNQLVQPGRSYYRFAVNRDHRSLLALGEENTHEAPLRAFAELERGLSRHISMGGQVSRLWVDDQWHEYLGAGLRVSAAGINAKLQWVQDTGGGSIAEAKFQTRVGKLRLSGSHQAFSNFRSELVSAGKNDVRSRSSLRLNGKIMPLAYTFSADHQDRQAGGGELILKYRLTLNRRALSLSHNLVWQQETSSPLQGPTTRGDLLANARIRGLRLRAGVNYDLRPEASLRKISLTASKQLTKNMSWRLSASRGLDPTKAIQLRTSLNHKLKKWIMGVNAYSREEAYGINFSISGQTAREPLNRSWIRRSQALMGSSAVSARVFLDHNLNNRFDKGDQPVAGVKFTVDNSKRGIQTNAEGTAFIHSLPVYKAYNLSVIRDSIEDPYWVPALKGVSGFGRPGQVLVMDFPLVESGDVEGTVYLKQSHGNRDRKSVV